MRTLTKNVVTRLAYLIGVRDDLLDKQYGAEGADILVEMRNSTEGKILRILNQIRAMMMQKYSNIDGEIRYGLKNLTNISYFNADDIKWLEQHDVHILQVNTTLDKYLIKVNQLIIQHVNDCKNLIPDWVAWEYIKDLFIIPGCSGSNSEAVTKLLKDERRKYASNIMFYPFQLYIHWNPSDNGNILSTDRKFLTVLYKQHKKEFYDNDKVMDANDEIKDSIYDFIDRSERTAVIVDCENSNVYKLYAVLKNLNQNEISKIKKIILYDDCHTNNTWKLLEKFVNIPLERIEVARVTDSKSLVDIKMTAGACREYYENKIDSFILVSSDSDFWGLISSLPQADFLVMIEYEKCGINIKRVLKENNIYYCSIDDFYSGNIDAIKNLALKTELTARINQFNATGVWQNMNWKEFVNEIYTSCRIEPTQTEKNKFIDKYIRSLRFEANRDGMFEMTLK